MSSLIRLEQRILALEVALNQLEARLGSVETAPAVERYTKPQQESTTTEDLQPKRGPGRPRKNG